MGYIIPDYGERAYLSAASSMISHYVGLFINDYTPVSSSLLSNLTECSDMNYTSEGRKQLSFGTPTISSGKAIVSASSAVSWVFYPDGMGMRTPFTVYGYFVTNDYMTGSMTGDPLIMERFSSPYYIDASSSLTISVGGPFKMSFRDANS